MPKRYLKIRKTYIKIRYCAHLKPRWKRYVYICKLVGGRKVTVSMLCDKLKLSELGIAGYFNEVRVMSYEGMFKFVGEELDEERERFKCHLQID